MLEEFDFSFQPSIDVRQIKELTTLAFVARDENVIFLGPPGVGKTYLAVGLAMQALRSGMTVYYTPGTYDSRLEKGCTTGQAGPQMACIYPAGHTDHR